MSFIDSEVVLIGNMTVCRASVVTLVVSQFVFDAGSRKLAGIGVFVANAWKVRAPKRAQKGIDYSGSAVYM